jgi:NADH dehydrogenase FAD-containing subunit
MGGGGNGTEVARFLAERRKRPNVTIVERASDIAPRAGEKIRRVVSQRLTELGVGWITSAQVKEIGDGTISIAVGGRQLELPMDTVVIAIGLKAERKLYDELKDKFTTYLIGDCLEPRNMLDAIHEGFKVGCEI